MWVQKWDMGSKHIIQCKHKLQVKKCARKIWLWYRNVMVDLIWAHTTILFMANPPQVLPYKSYYTNMNLVRELVSITSGL
jgi:hypothetical protein